MPIGNQASLSITQLNSDLGQTATNFHDAAFAAQDFFERINTLGITGLQAIGFTQTDAQNFFTIANQMNTAALVWFGSIAQTPAFNFDSATAAAR